MILVVEDIQSYVTCGWEYTIICYLWLVINNCMLLVIGDKHSHVTCCLGISNCMLLAVGDKQSYDTCGWG